MNDLSSDSNDHRADREGYLATRDYNRFQGVETRPCANCGGAFEFDIATQHLKCKGCGAGEEIVHEADAAVQEQAFPDTQDSAIAQFAGLAGGVSRTRLKGEKEIVCQNCGGHTTFVGSLTASRCPYCATPLQLTEVHEAPDRLAVDGVLPFQLDEDAATKALKAWVSNRWFAPNEFKKYSTSGSFSSLYAAYFTYDAHATTDYRGQRGRDSRVKVGNVSKTVTRWSPASGRVYDTFDDVTVLANTGLKTEHIRALEPWPVQELQPYTSSYLAGHLARTYDHDVTKCFVEARAVMDGEIQHTIKKDIGGDRQRIEHKQTYLQGVSYKHILLPIWLLTVLYGDATWQVFINGATGEVQGERPYSTVKIAFAVGAVIAVIIALLVLKAQY